LTVPFWKTLDFPVDDFDGAVDVAPVECVAEDHAERDRQIVPALLRIVIRQQEVRQVADLDRLGGALVGHVTSPRRDHAKRIAGLRVRE